MDAAHEWGVQPGEYFSWPKRDRTLALAYLRIKTALVNVLAEAAAKRAKRESK